MYHPQLHKTYILVSGIKAHKRESCRPQVRSWMLRCPQCRSSPIKRPDFGLPLLPAQCTLQSPSPCDCFHASNQFSHKAFTSATYINGRAQPAGYIIKVFSRADNAIRSMQKEDSNHDLLSYLEMYDSDDADSVTSGRMVSPHLTACWPSR